MMCTKQTAESWGNVRAVLQAAATEWGGVGRGQPAHPPTRCKRRIPTAPSSSTSKSERMSACRPSGARAKHHPPVGSEVRTNVHGKRVCCGVGWRWRGGRILGEPQGEGREGTRIAPGGQRCANSHRGGEPHSYGTDPHPSTQGAVPPSAPCSPPSALRSAPHPFPLPDSLGFNAEHVLSNSIFTYPGLLSRLTNWK